MDIEKLIEDLQWWAEHCDRTNYGCATRAILSDVATDISALQAENEKLRAELEQVKAERDAAVERIREWEMFDTYLLVHNFLTPEKWRGPQKED